MKNRSRLFGPVVLPALLVAAVSMSGCNKQPDAAPPTQPSAPPAPPASSGGTGSTPSTPVTSAIPEHPYAKPADYQTPAVQTTELPSGLKIEDLVIGQGGFCLPRAVVTFHYRSKVKDGAEFDATAERAENPEPETQSLTRLMPGLRDGLVGMKVGGRRRLTIPADLAFSFTGAKDPAGNIVVPPDATVVYVVDLVELKQGFAPTAPASGPEQPAAK